VVGGEERRVRGSGRRGGGEVENQQKNYGISPLMKNLQSRRNFEYLTYFCVGRGTNLPCHNNNKAEEQDHAEDGAKGREQGKN